MRRLDYIAHHGILGQKWGIRRYQNKDGSLTADGKKHYHQDYSSKQRKRDAALYGRKGVERINKELHRGNSIQGARHYEAERTWKREERARRVRAVKRGAKAVAGISVTLGGFMYSMSPEFRNTVNNGARAAGKYVANKVSQTKDSVNRARAQRNFRKWKVG